MHKGIIAFFAGVLIVQRLPALWPALIAVPFLVISIWRCWPLCGAVCAGVLWAAFRAALLLAADLDPRIEGETVIIRGTVADFPGQAERALQFELICQSVSLGDTPERCPERVRLSWYGAAPMLAPGEYWQLSVRLKRPWGTRNPGGFDFERWAFARGIRASGYVVSSRYNERLAMPSRWSLGYWRTRVHARLRGYAAGREYAGILVALVLGDQHAIPDAQWSVLRRTGTTHLVSVSGLHISVAAAIGYVLARWTFSLFPPLLRRMPAQTVGWIAALVFALVYAGLAGFSLPTQRAVIMLAVALVQRLRSRPIVAFATWSWSLLWVLLLNPLAVLEIGFWLSFGAVAIIFYVIGGRRGRVALPVRLCRIHLALALGLAPYAAMFFQQNPILGPLANLLAIPIVSWLVFPAVVAALALASVQADWAATCYRFAHEATAYLFVALERLAAVGPATLDLAAPGVFAVACATVGAGLLLLPRGLPMRWLGVAWFLPLALGVDDRVPVGTARLHVLDAGQGLAAIVQTTRHTLIFDTGPGTPVLVPLLRQLRVSQIDRLVVSHGDSDHTGGLPALIEDLPIDDALTSESIPALPLSRRCVRGMRWVWDDVRFEVLHPGAGTGRMRGNNASCVLRITTAGVAALLPGDIEREAERELLRNEAGRLRADLLLAPHHGSGTSSTPAFNAAVAPAQVVFAAGYRNRFGFPDPEVVARYQAQDAKTYNTSVSGMLTFDLGERLVGPTEYRKGNRRYWHSH